MKSFSELTSASQVNNDDLLAISQTSGSGYASKKTTVKDITDKSNLNLAEEYDSTSTYAVDDYVIYESVLYKCIASTTGTFDSTKWTSVVVTDEMGSGGGGGTGGHTIIDENGNSMTARAGLQFVGGANVSDDATNNKTIVDLASAGGIDGVFVDTGNVIQASTVYTGSFTYTAIEDCIVSIGYVVRSGIAFELKIDNVTIYDWASTYTGIGSQHLLIQLKKGQILSCTGDTQNASTYSVYGIQTGTTHSKFQPVIYSLEEREIGVWTDGKPLYEKTWTLNNLTLTRSAWTDTDIVLGLQQGDYTLIESIVRDSNYSILATQVAPWSSNDKVAIYNFRTADMVAVSMTLRYVKASDTAGSGSWTPQGVPTHHYSTDEHIIGTWIDGSTLYEKTIQTTSPSSNVDTSIADLTSLNIDVLVDLKGFIKSTNVNQFVPINWFYNDSGANLDNAMYYNTSSKNLYQLVTGSNYQDSTEYITIQYTKSS